MEKVRPSKLLDVPLARPEASLCTPAKLPKGCSTGLSDPWTPKAFLWECDGYRESREAGREPQ